MKLTRLLALNLALIISIQMHAQVSQLSLTAKPNDGIKFRTLEVWDLNIVSGYDQSFDVVLSAEVYGSDSRLIARLVSHPVRINPGLNGFDQNSIKTAQFAYINRDFGNFESSNGYLPDGDYSYCISLRCANQQCTEIYKTETSLEECFDVIGIVPSPLLLSSPGDDEIIEELRPNFTWIPPMPIGTDPNLSYEFTLVQLQKEQSGENAIRRNRPLYQIEGLQQISLGFPSELEDLVPGERYAWQVNAYLGRTFIQSSEVWEFEIKVEEFEIEPMPYVRLKQQTYPTFDALNTANFVYYERKDQSSIRISILDEKGNSVTMEPVRLDTKRGENHINFDLTGFDLEIGRVYKLLIIDSEGEKYELSIRYYYKR